MKKLNLEDKHQVFGGAITYGTGAAYLIHGVTTLLWSAIDIANIVIDYSSSKSKPSFKKRFEFNADNIESKNIIFN